MKAGYYVTHFLLGDSLGEKGINIAHVLNYKNSNKVTIAYFVSYYMPKHNASDTVAIFKIKPKTK